MDVLLDTNAFLWWIARDPRLHPRVSQVVGNRRNGVFVSAISVWEIAIKRRQGRLAFEGSAARAIAESDFVELPMDAADGEAAGDLDWPHKDPFDRLLVAQALRRRLVMVTSDQTLLDYEELPTLSAR